MSTFQVAPDTLRQASGPLDSGANTLSGTSIPAPNLDMYGELTGSAASDAEPRTNEQLNDLIQALSGVFAATSTNLGATCSAYVTKEQELEDLISTVERMLR